MSKGNPNWKPGVSANPNGRPKGTPNNATERIKEAYTDLLEGNLPNIQRWLNQVASEDPARALDFLMKLSPFVVPKKVSSDINFDSPIEIIIPRNETKEESDI
jgi:hypothetical protein